MSRLLEVSAFSLMELWAELIECYHEVNGYGGSVAEIYAYRFWMYQPRLLLDEWKESAQREMALDANQKLIEICKLFEKRYRSIRVTINDHYVDDWPPDYEFHHRVHVGVEKR